MIKCRNRTGNTKTFSWVSDNWWQTPTEFKRLIEEWALTFRLPQYAILCFEISSVATGHLTLRDSTKWARYVTRERSRFNRGTFGLGMRTAEKFSGIFIG